MSEVHLRAATASDGGFLAEMLAEACDWRPDVITRPVADLMGIPSSGTTSMHGPDHRTSV